ncbi:hypothetical protein SAMN05192559_10823 [Halobacillus karajensis]|uniref:Uncharacterized protein n=1 Tax=Halobacillus karajensis TaxID=195088 RepID=A0A024P4B3_9BACI|nr:hypothetical protein BN982_03195 [Halobacillus karajensis]CDQ23690.1 hypothetical protein BN983_01941 [Halobacillus karajensis]CDQ27168.1 hypothetical protein BN981_01422 [Halobacillus karajensis]SEI03816.1 hypothetical protein SAMN05192559_10823 [Halobacillus karajensis]
MLSIIGLFAFFFSVETIGSDLFTSFVSNNNSTFIQFSVGLLILVLLGFSFFLTSFQNKKYEGNIFKSNFWRSAPFIFVIAETLLIVLFIVFGVTGDLFVWVENQRWIIYLFMTSFILILYLAVVSIVARFNESSQSILKVSFYGSFLFLIISILMM